MRIPCCASLSSSSYPPFSISNFSNRQDSDRGFSPIRSSSSRSKLNPNSLILNSKFGQHVLFSSFESPAASRRRFSRQFDGIVRARPGSETAGEGPISHTVVQTLELGLMFGLWYFSNIYFSICNKELLKVFPHPITITAFHFFLGTIISLLIWGLNIYKKPTCTPYQILFLLPLALCHTFGNLLTNVSFGKVAVSFTHTVKAMEPFFSVLLSTLFLGEMPSVWVLLSLFPVVGGVGLASLTEASFNWAGFLSAMASNVINQSRNVFSKKFMRKEMKHDAMTNFNLFSILTIMSFFILTATALLVDGVKFTPTYLKSAGMNINDIYVKAVVSGFCFHFSQQASFLILGKVSPVTHSVGNCLKRVVVIVTSLIVFHTQVSPVNAFGTGIALAGVFLYSMAERMKARSL